MTRVALPVSSKFREFNGKLLLALHLANKGYKVAIGNRTEMYDVIDEIVPHIYFGLTGMENNSGLFARYSECGTKIIVLDTEGAVFPSLEYFQEVKLSDKKLQHVDRYFAWGEKNAEALAPFDLSNDRVYITGTPRFDLCQPELSRFFVDRCREYQEEYGRFVLVNTNFALANFPNSVEGLKEELPVPHYNQPKSNPIKYQQIGLQYLLLGSFVDMIGELAANMEDTSVVMRPHPYENIEFWRDAVKDMDSVHVRRTGSVRPWILAAEAVVHNNCTTGIESALLKTPVISYEPFEFSVKPPGISPKSHLPGLVSETAQTPADVVSAVNKWKDSKDDYILEQHQKQELGRYIHNLDSSATEAIVDCVDDLDVADSVDYSSFKSRRKWLKRLVKSNQMLAGSLSTRYRAVVGGTRSHLFPPLAREEVSETVRRLGDCASIPTEDMVVEPVIPWNEVYWISRSSPGPEGR